MKATLTPADLASSVISVPPLCRNADFSLNTSANEKLIRHLESGGVRLFLYGGNANFYNISLAEYAAVLDMLESASGPDSIVIPSVGPYYGISLDQATLLKGRNFPTAMVLPATFPLKPTGVATALRHFTDRAGIPVVVYIKNDGYTTVADVKRLVADGCVSWIKYAVVRPDERQDPFLLDLCQEVDPNLIISGMGEQPAIVHAREFGLGGFTSGCVCVAPALSMQMLGALQRGDVATAERIRHLFFPLEDLRNAHGPIPVLHHAVALADIADTGPMLPLLANLPENLQSTIREAARILLQNQN